MGAAGIRAFGCLRCQEPHPPMAAAFAMIQYGYHQMCRHPLAGITRIVRRGLLGNVSLVKKPVCDGMAISTVLPESMIA